jgi:inosine/xanthosine triphosphate pyrophosphatase family protein
MEVTKHKAKTAYTFANEPAVVTDTSWNIPALNGFPGSYMKDVANWFTAQDFVNLLSDKDDKRVAFTENIAYYDGVELKVFSKEFWGKLVLPRGTGNSIENVSEFNGKTLGEFRAEGNTSHEAEDYIWIDFARWYAGKSE